MKKLTVLFIICTLFSLDICAQRNFLYYPTNLTPAAGDYLLLWDIGTNTNQKISLNSLIYNDQIQNNHLNSNVVRNEGGLYQDANGALGVSVDGVTIDISGGELVVLDGGGGGGGGLGYAPFYFYDAETPTEIYVIQMRSDTQNFTYTSPLIYSIISTDTVSVVNQNTGEITYYFKTIIEDTLSADEVMIRDTTILELIIEHSLSSGSGNIVSSQAQDIANFTDNAIPVVRGDSLYYTDSLTWEDGQFYVNGTFTTGSNATINGVLSAISTISTTGRMQAGDRINVAGYATLGDGIGSDTTGILGDLTVTGNTNLDDDLTVLGTSNLNNTSITGIPTINGTLLTDLIDQSSSATNIPDYLEFDSLRILTEQELTLDSLYTAADSIEGIWINEDYSVVYLAKGNLGLWTYSINTDGSLTYVDSYTTVDANCIWGYRLTTGANSGKDVVYTGRTFDQGVIAYMVDPTNPDLTSAIQPGFPTTGDLISLAVVSIYGYNDIVFVGGNTQGVYSFQLETDIHTWTQLDEEETYSIFVNDLYVDANGVYIANGSIGLTTLSHNGSGVMTYVDTDDQGGAYAKVIARDSFIYVANSSTGILSYYYDESLNLTYVDNDEQGDGTYYDLWQQPSFTGGADIRNHIYVASSDYGILNYYVNDTGAFTYYGRVDPGDVNTAHLIIGGYGGEIYSGSTDGLYNYTVYNELFAANDDGVEINDDLTVNGDFINLAPHCALYVNTDTTINATQNVWYKFGIDGEKDLIGMIRQSDTIQLTKEGSYLINYTLSFSGSNNEVWEFAVFKNGVMEEPSQLRYTSTSDVGNASCPVYVESNGDDWISFRIRNTTDNDDPTIRRTSIVITTQHLE